MSTIIEIKRYQEKDVEEYMHMCKKAFGKHNVFDKSLRDVRDYLRKKDKADRILGGLFFAYDDDEFVGGALLRVEMKDLDCSHARYKYNHVVAKDNKVKSAILNFLEEKIKHDIHAKRIKSAKVEVGLVETEEDLELYKKAGFKIEGVLASHYKHKENVIALGKEI